MEELKRMVGVHSYDCQFYVEGEMVQLVEGVDEHSVGLKDLRLFAMNKGYLGVRRAIYWSQSDG